MNDDPYKPSYDDTDPTVQIRTDLWHTMTTTDLIAQRELIVTRLLKLGQILTWSATPSTQDIYLALQHGLDQINGLIDSKTTKHLT